MMDGISARELITIKFVDYARARLMTPQERQAYCKSFFLPADGKDVLYFI